MLRLGAPLGASVALRISQLLVMIAAAQTFPESDRASVLAGFGVVASFAVFSDSGASNYLLTRLALSRSILVRALNVQAVTTAIGAIVAVSFTWIALPWDPGLLGLGAVSAFALSQAVDSITRVARSARLQVHDDASYAAGDALLALTKFVLVALGLMLSWTGFIFALPVASLAIAWLVVSGAYRKLRHSSTDEAPDTATVLHYGLAGASSGLYSQAPYLVSAWLAPVESVAALAVILRTIQPVEIVPAVASQQLLPRIQPMRLTAPRLWFAFAGFGTAIGVAVSFSGGFIEILFSQPLAPALLLIVLASTLCPKFGNYLLSAFLLAVGGVRAKAALSLIVGSVVVLVCLALVPQYGTIAAAWTMLGGEVMLAVGLGVLVRAYRSKEEPRNI